jgi:organic hydroperoxide reductase OsmC/OhrA
MAVKAKVLNFSASLDADGRASAEKHEPQSLPGEWTAEHLVLIGLAQCSLTSLGYFARQRGSTVDGSADVRGSVTLREDEEVYGFVEIEIELDVRIEPEPDDVRELLDRAEWGCFIGQSLKPKPAYRWRVNDREVA